MFDGSNYPQSLEEDTFDQWLEKGRASKMSYAYLLVVWNALEEQYQPIYIENRSAIGSYEWYPMAASSEALIAVYDLYSEAKLNLDSDYRS